MNSDFIKVASRLAMLACVAATSCPAADNPVSIDLAYAASRKTLETECLRKLDQFVDVEFVDTPLVDAFDVISEFHNIKISFDFAALKDAGISANDWFTISEKDVRLREALTQILENQVGDLTWYVRSDCVHVTSIDAASERDQQTRLYDVTKLVSALPEKKSATVNTQSKTGSTAASAPSQPARKPSGEGQGFFAANDAEPPAKDADVSDGSMCVCGFNPAQPADFVFDPLVEAIRETVLPESWSVMGGYASIAPLLIGEKRVIVVRQSRRGHEELAALMEQLLTFASTVD